MHRGERREEGALEWWKVKRRVSFIYSVVVFPDRHARAIYAMWPRGRHKRGITSRVMPVILFINFAFIC